MSDINEIVPEKDWKKVKIQDYPATPTPQNVPSEHFFNGMSDVVKLSESKIQALENSQFIKKNLMTIRGKLPLALGWQNNLQLDTVAVGYFPFVLSFRVKNTNGVWLDGSGYASYQQGGNGSVTQIQLSDAVFAGRDFEMLLVRNM